MVKGTDSSSLATYGVIHISLGHISAQVRILGIYHVILSFVHFISFDTLCGLYAFRKPLLYNMYLFNLRIANHILIRHIFSHSHVYSGTCSSWL